MISSRRTIVSVVAATSLILASAFVVHLARSSVAAAPDFSCTLTSDNGQVDIAISSGESGSEIAQALFDNAVTRSTQAFFRVAVGDPKSKRIAPGIHRLDKGICATTALTQLLDSSRISGLIDIVEGAWLSEIVPQLYSAGMSRTDVSLAIKSVARPQGFKTLEGLLFPAQYSFEKGTSAKVALQAMINRSVSEMKSAGFFDSNNKFTPQQLLTIASLIQAEGNTQDFQKISQVIRNRISKGMPLQFDSTVHYVKKLRGSVFLSTQSTLINSPYNTYRRYGLPPGPINNPGAKALEAAVNPTPGNWTFFITVAPFDTRFTNDLRQFNEWKLEYKKNLQAGKFRSKK